MKPAKSSLYIPAEKWKSKKVVPNFYSRALHSGRFVYEKLLCNDPFF